MPCARSSPQSSHHADTPRPTGAGLKWRVAVVEQAGPEALLTLAARSDNGTDLQVLTLFVGSHLQCLYNDLQTRYDALRAAQEGKP